MNFTRRKFLKSMAYYSAGAACTMPIIKCSTSGSANKPNIIFIMADDLGYGDLGCYGQEQIQTPNIDQLAREGIKFTDFYAGSTVCAPSRCALMTGLHTGHSRIRGNEEVPLRDDDITVAELLKKAGYKTGCIGKWGLGEAGTTGTPNEQGFDYFFGYLSQIRAHNYYTDYLWRNQEKVLLDNEVIFAEKGYAKGIGSASTNRKTYSHDLFAKEALKFIDESAGSPFFLYLPFTIPHSNNQYKLTENDGMEVPDYGIYADKDWPNPQKGLAAMITRMDSDIGKIKHKLIDLGIAENTLLIFTSDNGPHKEGLNDPDYFNSNGVLRGIKRDLYEGGIRVPLIADWPKTIKPGIVTEHASAFWDVLPTLCGVAGAKVNDNIDGISFLPTLLGQNNSQKEHDYLYWEFGHNQKGAKQAIRYGKWKMVRPRWGEPIEVYNLENDPGETNNIADSLPELVRLAKELFKDARTPDPNWKLSPIK